MADRSAGRILRAPTLFEDAVKVLCTTNCSWALTKAMVTRMIAAFGRGGAFPDAAFLASLPERRLREELKLGYRAPFLHAFAARVASGALDLSTLGGRRAFRRGGDGARPRREGVRALRGRDAPAPPRPPRAPRPRLLVAEEGRRASVPRARPSRTPASPASTRRSGASPASRSGSTSRATGTTGANGSGRRA